MGVYLKSMTKSSLHQRSYYFALFYLKICLKLKRDLFNTIDMVPF